MSALVTGICLLMIVYMVYRIIVLLKRNKQLAEALNDMLLAKPTPEQRANAFNVLCAETGQQP